MKHEHITPILHMIHWLPVEQQIHFKLLFKDLHGQAPDYIRDLLKPTEEYRPSRSLRSHNCMFLSIPDFNMVNRRRWSYSHAAPRVWNNIPVEIRKTDIKSEFKNKLKLTCLNHVIIVRQSLNMTTNSCIEPLGTLWILALYKFYILYIILVYYIIMYILGDDCVLAERPWIVSPPIDGGLKYGDSMVCDTFPIIWRQDH